MSLVVDSTRVSSFAIGEKCWKKSSEYLGHHYCKIILQNGEGQTVFLSDRAIARLVEVIKKEKIEGIGNWNELHSKEKETFLQEAPPDNQIFSEIFFEKEVAFRVLDAAHDHFQKDKDFYPLIKSLENHLKKIGKAPNGIKYLQNWRIDKNNSVETKTYDFLKKFYGM